MANRQRSNGKWFLDFGFKSRRCLTVLFGLLLAPLPSSAADAVELVRKGDTVDVLIGGRPFTTYFFPADIAKPYFQPLRTAQGTIVTRDFIIGNTIPQEHLKDRSLEPHQRPMYFGHGNIDGIDFWGEAAFPQYSDDTVFGRATVQKAGRDAERRVRARCKADFELADPRGRVIADEIQSFVFGGDAEHPVD